MIDENKLIERLQEYIISSTSGDFAHGLVTAVYVTMNQPKIGGWIPCSERLPDEKINPVTNDFYEYQVTFKSDKVTDVRHYKFGRGHWWNCGQNMDKYVTAWREPLEAYHG